jgi:hypothetical protein
LYVLGLILLGFAARARGEPLVPMTLLPAGVEEYLFLNYKALIESDLGKKHTSAIENAVLDAAIDASEIMTRAGFDLKNDLDGLFLFGRVNSDKKNEEFVILGSGRFDARKLTAVVEQRAREDRGHVSLVRERNLPCLRLLRTVRDKPAEFYATALDGRYILLSTRQTFLASLDRYLGKKPPVLRSTDVVSVLDSSNVLQMFKHQMSSDELRRQLEVTDPEVIRLLAKTTVSRGEVSVTSGVKLSMAFDAMDAATAEELKLPVSHLIDQAKQFLTFHLSLPEAKPLLELNKKAVLSINGKTLSFETGLARESIDALLAEPNLRPAR